jgi:hypothetical protein
MNRTGLDEAREKARAWMAAHPGGTPGHRRRLARHRTPDAVQARQREPIPAIQAGRERQEAP